MKITIIKTGMGCSLQHFGCWGEQEYGVPVGGVMDPLAAAMANIICGNKEDAPLIEMTLHGAEILFNTNAIVSITGGGSVVLINDVEIPFNKLIHVPAFAVLKTKPSRLGCRSYLAIANSIESNQTDLVFSSWQIHYPEAASTEKIVDCIEGPEWDWFDKASQKIFLESVFTLSTQSNRMGYRLEGNVLNTKEKKELISTAVTKGIIQVTHEGNPILLMADAQTTGGYPRIARVASADLSILAQSRPGDKIFFKKIDEEDAMKKITSQENWLKKIKTSVSML